MEFTTFRKIAFVTASSCYAYWDAVCRARNFSPYRMDDIAAEHWRDGKSPQEAAEAIEKYIDTEVLKLI